jgi:predicted aspartyl protease
MRRMFSRSAGGQVLCAAVVAFFGSAHPVSGQETARGASRATAPSNAPTGSPSLPVFYDPALAAQGFPNPLVKARVSGHEATFIVDSGAGTNVLADWYVEAASIPSAESDSTARGSSGKVVAVRVVRQLQGEWSDGQRLRLNEAIVVGFPPYFKSLRIGGVLSPQLLGPAGAAAVLNLKIPSLQFVPYAQAVSELRRSNAPGVPIDLTKSCHNASAKFVNRHYVAPVTTEGVTDLMLIDTGATGTIFHQDSRIARAIESRSVEGAPSEGIGGEVTARRMVRDVQLMRGGRIVTLSPSIGDVSASCQAKGILGMDALRSCSLVLGDGEMAFSCG